MLRTLRPGGSISSHEKTTQGGRRGSPAVHKFATKGTENRNIRDYCEVEKIRYQGVNFLLHMERCKPLGSLNSFLSYALQLGSVQSLSPVQTPWTAACQASLTITSSRSLLSGAKFCLLIVCILNSSLTLRRGRCGRWLLRAFPELSANTCVGGNVCWLSVLGALIHIWRQETMDGCDISCLWIWQQTFNFTSWESQWWMKLTPICVICASRSSGILAIQGQNWPDNLNSTQTFTLGMFASWCAGYKTEKGRINGTPYEEFGKQRILNERQNRKNNKKLEIENFMAWSKYWNEI